MAKKIELKTTKKPQKEISQKKPRKIKTIIEKAEKENITEADNSKEEKTDTQKETKSKKEKKEIKKSPSNKKTKLTIKEKAFCREYAKTGNGSEAIMKAGYGATSIPSASAISTRLLKNVLVQQEISRLTELREKKSIMSAQEVLEHFTAIARGEEKDQFGLDISAGDRLKALAELAKRTIDIENRVKGTPDNVVNIKVDWRKS